MPPATLPTSRAPGSDEEPGRGGGPPAEVADQQQRPVGRQVGDPAGERGHRDEERVRGADLGELDRLADVDEERAAPGPRAGGAPPR